MTVSHEPGAALQVVGEAWLQTALAEHASIAAFARLILHMMSLAAPPDLLDDAIRAMSDELEHARLAFGLARKFNGFPAGPGRMEIGAALAQPHDAGSILKAAIIEGCFEETVSARCAEAALQRTEDADVAAALTRIARDESNHAELSWRLAAWILRAYPELAPSAEEWFARGLATPEDNGEEDGAPIIERYGHLLPSSRRGVRRTTMRDEIVPRIVALLGVHPSMRQAGVVT